MVRTSNVDRGTALGTLARHLPIMLPPNSPITYGSATAAASFTATAFATLPGRTAIQTPGGAVCNVTVQAATATGFTSAMTLQVRVTGLDENYDPATEIITCIGNASATQSFGGSILFSQVTTIEYQSVGATPVSGMGGTFSVGCGDGAASPATLLIPNPFPFLPAASFVLFPTGVSANSAANYIVVGGVALPDGRGGNRAWRPTTNYTATVNARLAMVCILNQQSSAVEL